MELVKPSLEHKEEVWSFREELIKGKEDFAGCAGLEKSDTYEEWLDFDNRRKREHGDGYSPSAVFLAVVDGKVVGIIDCRYVITPFLMNFGGNIGYSIKPSERRKGYAGEMLKLALDVYKNKGYDKVLITCNKENEGSRRTILKNGGVLENEVPFNEDGVWITLQRYWVNLNK